MSVYGGPHTERLDPTNSQCAVCEEVRGAAAHAFQVLQYSIRDSAKVERALAGLQQILSKKSCGILPYFYPQISSYTDL